VVAQVSSGRLGRYSSSTCHRSQLSDLGSDAPDRSRSGQSVRRLTQHKLDGTLGCKHVSDQANVRKPVLGFSPFLARSMGSPRQATRGGLASNGHKPDADRSTFSSITLCSVRPYDSPMTVDFLAHSLPLMLIAAVGPVCSSTPPGCRGCGHIRSLCFADGELQPTGEAVSTRAYRASAASNTATNSARALPEHNR
jgi:hypothetical protein